MRFFISSNDIISDTVTITGDDCVHIGVSLRCRPNDVITVCDEQMHEYTCEIISITPDAVKAKIVDRKTAAAKSAKEEEVVAAVVADAKMDIPEAMVETTQRQMIQEFAQNIQMQGLSMEQYFSLQV